MLSRAIFAYCTTFHQDSVLIYLPSRYSYASYGEGLGDISSPSGLAVDPQRNILFVSEAANDRIQCFLIDLEGIEAIQHSSLSNGAAASALADEAEGDNGDDCDEQQAPLVPLSTIGPRFSYFPESIHSPEKLSSFTADKGTGPCLSTIQAPSAIAFSQGLLYVVFPLSYLSVLFFSF